MIWLRTVDSAGLKDARDFLRRKSGDVSQHNGGTFFFRQCGQALAAMICFLLRHADFTFDVVTAESGDQACPARVPVRAKGSNPSV